MAFFAFFVSVSTGTIRPVSDIANANDETDASAVAVPLSECGLTRARERERVYAYSRAAAMSSITKAIIAAITVVEAADAAAFSSCASAFASCAALYLRVQTWMVAQGDQHQMNEHTHTQTNKTCAGWTGDIEQAPPCIMVQSHRALRLPKQGPHGEHRRAGHGN